MKVEAEQVLCRFHLSTFARRGTEPLYRWIVETARHDGLQGATVLRGIMGLGPDGSILEETREGPTHELPVIVEVVDGPRRIEALLARVEPVFHAGAITLERAHVVLYRGEGDSGVLTSPGIDVIATQDESAALRSRR